MLQNIKKKTEGFTIIEVMIVLAIAALIMLIVLVAVPQLQKNQRNAARRDVTGRIKTEVDNYTANNNGSIPTAAQFASAPAPGGAFYAKYISTNVSSFQDPKTGNYTVDTAAAAITATSTLTEGTIYYRTNQICAGETTTATGAGGRNYALLVHLEGGSNFCVDNR
jgi:prepilin-type N-terminal cleavage/methylation domain-containing protein